MSESKISIDYYVFGFLGIVAQMFYLIKTKMIELVFGSAEDDDEVY